ncbi:hypothetical protein [Microbulbifer aggregans]|uniref:hypothetical protein n=1 Tax=Microbulbifer aggregans TaxID=1769779 RepID=UPI001CFCEB09|nr:hypothetical protein [Microbulbifer aggregans]
MPKSRILLWGMVLAVMALVACGGQNKSAGVEKAPESAVEQAAPQEEESIAPVSKPAVPDMAGERKMQSRSDNGSTLWVMQPMGNRQCEGGGISLEQSRATLQQGGVSVAESRCAVRTDRMYPQVCGGATGDILVHRIPATMLDTALALGFDPASQVPHRFKECPPSTGTGSPRNPTH